MNPTREHSNSRAQWQVRKADTSTARTLSDLVMAWAKDATSGQPTYIFELGPDRTGSKCGCICYGCERPLTAVNAAKSAWQKRPHFRHPDGAERDTCWVLTARAAALEMLQESNQLVLPARTIGMPVIGISGKEYHAWVSKPPEQVAIRSFKPRDQVSAVLTLEDGREVLVRLTGSLESAQDGDVLPVILLEVDEPELAALSPDELRRKLHLLVKNGSWCGNHWDDARLADEAAKKATADANDALDFVPPTAQAELNSPISRETLLHWLTKEILRESQRLRVPELIFSPTRNRTAADFEPAIASRNETQLEIQDIRLEKKVGSIRPDVVARYRDPADGMTGTLLIEVTVTNQITQERLERILSEGQAAIEIDISKLGGVVTKSDFTRLVVDELAAKRWLCHPWLTLQKDRYDTEIRQAAQIREQALAELRTSYLAAVVTHSTLRALEASNPGIRQERKNALENIKMLATELSHWGLDAAGDELLFAHQGCILDRLLSIRDNRVVGYRVQTLWQVINAILCEKEPYLEWHTLYLTALKAYAPPLNPEHSEKVKSWRSTVWRSLSDGELQYRRRRNFDTFLGFLFPEMSVDLRKPLPGNSSAVSSGALAKQIHALDMQTTATSSGRHPGGRTTTPTGDDLWLQGLAYEEWRRRYPEAARLWENHI